VQPRMRDLQVIKSSDANRLGNSTENHVTVLRIVNGTCF
jgi:hypothetical protein